MLKQGCGGGTLSGVTEDNKQKLPKAGFGAAPTIRIS